jgi:hypothetical protein
MLALCHRARTVVRVLRDKHEVYGPHRRSIFEVGRCPPANWLLLFPFGDCVRSGEGIDRSLPEGDLP